MKSKSPFLAACFVGALNFSPSAHAQNASPVDALFPQLVGTWNVEQRIWTGPDTEAIQPPAAVARRRLIGGTILEEIMETAPGSGQDPFTRIAYFNYNKVTQRHETISIDTRAPQMMYETSYEDNAGHPERTVKLSLEDNFVLPQWGKTANAAFKGRKEIEFGKDRQTVRLYWTPLAGEDAKEFLAGEYVYTRRR